VKDADNLHIPSLTSNLVLGLRDVMSYLPSTVVVAVVAPLWITMLSKSMYIADLGRRHPKWQSSVPSVASLPS
jgi:hypothetical protein